MLRTPKILNILASIASKIGTILIGDNLLESKFFPLRVAQNFEAVSYFLYEHPLQLKKAKYFMLVGISLLQIILFFLRILRTCVTCIMGATPMRYAIFTNDLFRFESLTVLHTPSIISAIFRKGTFCLLSSTLSFLIKSQNQNHNFYW